LGTRILGKTLLRACQIFFTDLLSIFKRAKKRWETAVLKTKILNWGVVYGVSHFFESVPKVEKV